jgi:CHAT domain-containing protein
LQVPSLNALVALRSLPPEPAAAPVVLADPQGDLPAAETEALVVAAQLGPSARVRVGQRATSGELRQTGRASLLHLALHSGVDAAGPWLRLYDRRVAAEEILDWRVRADVVVLSSCASAATPDPGLWGSLAASFLAAGTRSVVGSLWSTKDEVNRRFVEDFYAAGGARDPAVALARTQQAWITRGQPPAEWAGFAFFGAGPMEDSRERSLTDRRTVNPAPCAKGD